MNDMLSLQKEARTIFREVLNQKDIVIKELTKQIIDYQGEIIQLDQKFQNYQRQQAKQIDEHNIQALINAGFIITEDSQFHIMIDITQVIHQRSQILRLDSGVQIIKEVNNSLNMSKQFIDLYQGLRNENNILAKQLSDKDMEYQSIIESFNKQIKDNSDRYQKKIAQMQQKIENIQQQKEMIELESQQILSERSNYYASKDEFKDRDYLASNYCDNYRIKLNDFAEKYQKIRKEKIELQVKLEEINKKYQQLIQQKTKMKQKEQGIDLQHNKFVTLSEDNESFSIQHQHQQDFTEQKLKILKLSIKRMTLQSQCFSFQIKPNISDVSKKLQKHYGAQNMVKTQMKVEKSSQKSANNNKQKGKKMIRIGY